MKMDRKLFIRETIFFSFAPIITKWNTFRDRFWVIFYLSILQIGFIRIKSLQKSWNSNWEFVSIRGIANSMIPLHITINISGITQHYKLKKYLQFWSRYNLCSVSRILNRSSIAKDLFTEKQNCRFQIRGNGFEKFHIT